MSLTLTIATEADVPSILPMMEEFNRLEGIVWTREAGGPALRALLSDPNLGRLGIFREDGAVIGYFVVTFGFDLEWNGRDAFLTELFLVAERRAAGRGPALMAALEDVARGAGARALHLMVRVENEPARRLYQSQGYTIPPRVFMTKLLAARA